MRLLLTESDLQVERWRTEILQALGSNGRVITDVLPELTLLIGGQPPLADLPATEAERRFHLTLRDFLRVFATQEHPLVLFLDDLQWADLATSRFLSLLLGDQEHRYLLVLGAYRTSEGAAEAGLFRMADEIAATGAHVKRLTLGPLTVSDVAALLRETLRRDLESVTPLAEVLARKTDGTALFVHETIQSLHEQGFITRAERQWRWDIQRIAQAPTNATVAELLTKKIARLTDEQQRLVRAAACIGRRFSLAALAVVTGMSPQDVGRQLLPALDKGLLAPTDVLYKYALIDTASDTDAGRAELKFAHDRIQSAAHELLSSEEREEIHLRIARHLLVETDEVADVFVVADHLNRAARLLIDPAERLRAARIELSAGQRAKRSTAYDQSRAYLDHARQFLPDAHWETQYELSLEIYSELSEATYLSGDLDRAGELFRESVGHARTALEKARIHNTWMAVYLHDNQPEEAVRLGLEALKLLGHSLPAKPGMASVILEVLRAKWMLRNLTAEKLAALPRASDPILEETVRLLMNLTVPVYLTNQNLFKLLPNRVLTLSLARGNASFSPYGYAAFGAVTCFLFGNSKLGYELGNLALQMSDRFGHTQHLAKVALVHGSRIVHWSRHWKHSLEHLRLAHSAGVASGDVIYAGYAADAEALFAVVGGRPLDEALERAESALSFSKKHRNAWSVAYDALLRQVVFALQGKTNALDELDDADYAESEFLATHASDKLLLHTHACFKIQVLYLAGAYEKAFELGEQTRKYLEDGAALITVQEFTWYAALASAALLSSGGARRPAACRKALRAASKAFAKWAASAPENYRHKALVLDAELARLGGDDMRAAQLFDKAIDEADAAGFVQCAAIASRRAAEMYRSRGVARAARAYETAARKAFAQWGATRVVSENDARRSVPVREPEAIVVSDATTSTRSRVDELDFAAVLHASQMLSGEAVLADVLRKTMQIVLHGSGGQRAVLFLSRSGKLTMEAEATSIDAQARVLQSVPLDEVREIPHAIVRFVARSRERLVIDDSSKAKAYRHDPYLAASAPLSILCTPILHQGILSGVLYCENQLATGSFNESRAHVVTILASQIALAVKQAESVIDTLTRLWMRGYFFERASADIAKTRQDGGACAFLVCDLDHFKQKNDTLGHLAGDVVLREVSRRISTALRPSDLVGRFGGEEIVVLLPATGREQAALVADRLRRAVAAPLAVEGREVVQTVSIGLAMAPEHGNTLEELIAAADKAVYRAKATGRDRVVIA